MDKTCARDIMSTEIIAARPDMTIEEALKLLVNNKITGLPIVADDGKMEGVLSEYDILKQLSGAQKITGDAFRKKITYTKRVDTIPENMPIDQLMDLFVDTKYRRLPVVDRNGKLVGIVTRRDLMRVFYYRSKLS